MLSVRWAHSITLIVLTDPLATAALAMYVRVCSVLIVAVKCAVATCAHALVADNMNNTKKITLCGIMAALAVAVMLSSYFPYLTYAIPAAAGLFMMVPLIECGLSWAFGTYAVSAAIIFLTAETEAKLLYVLFLGYYPILKSSVERINKQIIEWLLKLAVFNTAVISCNFILKFIFSMPFGEFGLLGKSGYAVFLGLCNIVFVIYDIGISRVADVYIHRLHGKIKKILN